MTDDFYVKLTSIELVFPPFSSQDAVLYERSNDAELEAVLRSSHLYFVAGRPQAAFGRITQEGDFGVSFDLLVAGEPFARSYLDLGALETTQGRRTEGIDFLANEHMIHVTEASGDETVEGELLDWFTPDKLAWDCARAGRGLEQVVIPRELVTFDLLYVGIATETDSYARLIDSGHKAKAEILANEPQRFTGARVADEIYFFLMHPKPLFIRMIGDDWEEPEPPPSERIVADLEKAFVSQLGPEYNRIRYTQYPAGRDGLAESGLHRYGYAIAEDLVFRTAVGDFRGYRDPRSGIAARADLLLVDDQQAAVVTIEAQEEQAALWAQPPAD